MKKYHFKIHSLQNPLIYHMSSKLSLTIHKVVLKENFHDMLLLVIIFYLVNLLLL